MGRAVAESGMGTVTQAVAESEMGATQERPHTGSPGADPGRQKCRTHGITRGGSRATEVAVGGSVGSGAATAKTVVEQSPHWMQKRVFLSSNQAKKESTFEPLNFTPR